MGQIPIGEISHKPGQMSEDAEYALIESKQAISVLEKQIESKLSKDEFNKLIKYNEKKNYITKEEFNEFLKFFEQSKLEKKELFNILNLINKKIEEVKYKDLLSSINIMSLKIENLMSALRTLSIKLDNEDVTNLDTDYEQIVNDELN